MNKLLVIGATSAIAQEVSKCFARESAWIFLVGRNDSHVTAVAEDLRVRGAGRVESLVLDLDHVERHEEVLATVIKAFGEFDSALIAYGTLPDQADCEGSARTTVTQFTTNCTSVVSLLTHLANYFEQRRTGCLAVITSVAGDRGRRNNYVYGAAKGAVGIFLQGLRMRLWKSGVRVLTIKPGLVDTPMTAALKKNLLYADPASVGRRIAQAMRREAGIVYVPWFWRWIMLVIRTIPEAVFRKLQL